MKAGSLPASPDSYVDSLGGWQRACVEKLRAAVRKAGADEIVKWGHLVYVANGPVFMIRATDERVLFGFWRGQRLRSLEPQLQPGGKYEMARLVIRKDTKVDFKMANRLAREAVALNQKLGDPTKI